MNNERFRENVTQIVLLDFDRTICKVELAKDFFYEAMGGGDKHSGFRQVIRMEEKRVELLGDSFAPLEKLRSMIGDEDIDKIKSKFLNLAKGKLLYSDVSKFLKKLDSDGIPYELFTRAVDREWQLWKILASEYTGESEILERDQKDKGKVIEERRTNGKYEIEIDGVNYISKSVSLIDDRIDAFESLPDGCSGFWIQRDDKFNKKLMDKKVEIIKGLSELEIVGGRLRKKKL